MGGSNCLDIFLVIKQRFVLHNEEATMTIGGICNEYDAGVTSVLRVLVLFRRSDVVEHSLVDLLRTLSNLTSKAQLRIRMRGFTITPTISVISFFSA